MKKAHELREVALGVWRKRPEELSLILHPEGYENDIMARIGDMCVVISNTYDKLIVDAIEIDCQIYPAKGEVSELLTAARNKFRESMGYIPTKEQQKSEVALVRGFKEFILAKEL